MFVFKVLLMLLFFSFTGQVKAEDVFSTARLYTTLKNAPDETTARKAIATFAGWRENHIQKLLEDMSDDQIEALPDHAILAIFKTKNHSITHWISKERLGSTRWQILSGTLIAHELTTILDDVVEKPADHIYASAFMIGGIMLSSSIILAITGPFLIPQPDLFLVGKVLPAIGGGMGFYLVGEGARLLGARKQYARRLVDLFSYLNDHAEIKLPIHFLDRIKFTDNDLENQKTLLKLLKENSSNEETLRWINSKAAKNSSFQTIPSIQSEANKNNAPELLLAQLQDIDDPTTAKLLIKSYQMNFDKLKHSDRDFWETAAKLPYPILLQWVKILKVKSSEVPWQDSHFWDTIFEHVEIITLIEQMLAREIALAKRKKVPPTHLSPFFAWGLFIEALIEPITGIGMELARPTYYWWKQGSLEKRLKQDSERMRQILDEKGRRLPDYILQFINNHALYSPHLQSALEASGRYILSCASSFGAS